VAVKPHAGLLGLCLLLPLPVPAGIAGGQVLEIDAAASQVGFSLQTRWGQVLEGRLPAWRGQVVEMPGGQWQVRMLVDAREVEIVGHPRYTRLTRGESFFHVRRWPDMELQSDPFPPALLREGGDLAGIVGMRGLRRGEVFHVVPASCMRPLLDCPVVVEGEVSRADYGMERWALALGDTVRFHLSLWAREPATT